jgi:ATP-binding cassette, subfamily B, bacterial
MEPTVYDHTPENPLYGLARKAVAPSPRSILPGRERWQVAVLRDRLSLCTSLDRVLRQTHGVADVSVNTGLGSILVRFDIESYPDGFGAVLSQAVESVVIGSILESDFALTALHEAASMSPEHLRSGGLMRIAARLLPPQTPPSASEIWKDGAFIGAVALVAGAFLPAAYFVGSVVCVATGLIIKHFWEKSNWANQPSSFGSELQPVSPDRSHPIRRLIKTLPHLESKIWIASLCSVATKVVNMMPSLIIGFALTIVSTGPSPWLSGALGITTAPMQLLFVVGVGALMWALES